MRRSNFPILIAGVAVLATLAFGSSARDDTSPLEAVSTVDTILLSSYR